MLRRETPPVGEANLKAVLQAMRIMVQVRENRPPEEETMSRLMPRRILAHGVWTLVVALLAACSNAVTQPPQAVGVTVVAGDGQTGTADSPLPELVVARAVDKYGDVVSRTIYVQILAGDGAIAMPGRRAAGNAVLTSQTLGEAKVQWTLGASGPQQLRFFTADASGDTLSAVASATLAAGG